MPIGVPRIIYCWGEELPPQWTDIYNFIFRRRMVFLMQYLDDELCNQICGLLINIHMEDRSKELEKKEIEKSGIFKSSSKSSNSNSTSNSNLSTPPVGYAAKKDKELLDLNQNKKLKKDKSMDDLLNSYVSNYEEDLAIDENYTLEQYTLQKITLEWLNWNAQFFDYSDEPYLFYLAEILSKDFTKDQRSLNETGQLLYNFNTPASEAEGLINSNSYLFTAPFTNKKKNNKFKHTIENLESIIKPFYAKDITKKIPGINGNKKNTFEVYSPFRSILNLANLISKDNFSFQLFHSGSSFNINNLLNQLNVNNKLKKLLGLLASKEFLNKNINSQNQQSVATKMLGQRNLRKEYSLDNMFFNSSLSYYNDSSKAILKNDSFILNNKLESNAKKLQKKKALNYLDFNSTNFISRNENKKSLNQPWLYNKVLRGNNQSFNSSFSYKDEYSRKQTKRALQEEESKKVFVIINSFGGSVGNGITVHDALQFIKAGSLTLGLGVAASAASLVLAGGTISERYVTEGCHVMLHQPEGGLNGQASDIWIDSQEIMKIRLDVAEIYSLSAHRPRHKILRDLDRDFYLTATETIHYGLADEIATNEVMHEIIEMTSKVWDYHDSKQQRLLETRNSASGADTQTQS